MYTRLLRMWEELYLRCCFKLWSGASVPLSDALVDAATRRLDSCTLQVQKGLFIPVKLTKQVCNFASKNSSAAYQREECQAGRGLWDLTWKGSDGLSSLHVRAQPHPQCSRSAGKIASLMFAPPEDGDVVSREHWKEHAEACELGGLTPAQQPRSAPRSTRCGHRCPPRHFGKARPSMRFRRSRSFFLVPTPV